MASLVQLLSGHMVKKQVKLTTCKSRRPYLVSITCLAVTLKPKAISFVPSTDITPYLQSTDVTPLCLALTDLVPRSRFGSSRTKKRGRGEGKGEEETRSGKIRIKTGADWLIGPDGSTRVLFLSLAVLKTRQRSFIELKRINQLCLTSTEHNIMYLIFSDTGRAVNSI